jgi:5-methyltetrahydrofolate--homocysteine methyltransferase
MIMAKHEDLFEAICKGNRKLVEQIVNQQVAASTPVVELLNDSMIPAMRSMGDKFSRNEVYVPEMLIAARAMQAGLKIIEPILAKAGHKPLARVCIGTVKGDLHDIGKNLVASMLEGGGFKVVDLGVDVPPERFVEAAKEKDGTIVALSALLTTTMTMMKNVIQALEKAGIRQKTRVMIGGAPITQQYADEIGADGYSDNASTAVALARKLA